MIQARTIYKGNSEKGKAAIIQDLISCLAEVEQQLRGNEGDSWRAELGHAKWQLETTKAELNETKWQLITARAELGRARERIEGLEARIAMYKGIHRCA